MPELLLVIASLVYKYKENGQEDYTVKLIASLAGIATGDRFRLSTKGIMEKGIPVQMIAACLKEKEEGQFSLSRNHSSCLSTKRMDKKEKKDKKVLMALFLFSCWAGRTPQRWCVCKGVRQFHACQKNCLWCLIDIACSH